MKRPLFVDLDGDKAVIEHIVGLEYDGPRTKILLAGGHVLTVIGEVDAMENYIHGICDEYEADGQ